MVSAAASSSAGRRKERERRIWFDRGELGGPDVSTFLTRILARSRFFDGVVFVVALSRSPLHTIYWGRLIAICVPFELSSVEAQ